LRARGGYYVSVVWDKHSLEGAQIIAMNEGTCRVRTGAKVNVVSNGKSVKAKLLADGAIEFKTRASQIFFIVPKPAGEK
jgi:hypothetical protein